MPFRPGPRSLPTLWTALHFLLIPGSRPEEAQHVGLHETDLRRQRAAGDEAVMDRYIDSLVSRISGSRPAISNKVPRPDSDRSQRPGPMRISSTTDIVPSRPILSNNTSPEAAPRPVRALMFT